MASSMHSHSSVKFAIFTITLVLFAVGATVKAQWGTPGSSPPDGNVAPPIHVGDEYQIKEGDLGAERFRSSWYCDEEGENCFELTDVTSLLISQEEEEDGPDLQSVESDELRSVAFPEVEYQEGVLRSAVGSASFIGSLLSMNTGTAQSEYPPIDVVSGYNICFMTKTKQSYSTAFLGTAEWGCELERTNNGGWRLRATVGSSFLSSSAVACEASCF